MVFDDDDGGDMMYLSFAVVFDDDDGDMIIMMMIAVMCIGLLCRLAVHACLLFECIVCVAESVSSMCTLQLSM